MRAYLADAHAAPLVDEEYFRLITGFNDIFVVIATVLVLGAVAWLGSQLANSVGGIGVMLASWGLAEYFTRRRRMALPSILLLLSFVGATFASVLALAGDEWFGSAAGSARGTAAAACAAAAAWLHWRRFHVPITVAAGAAALVGVVLFPILTIEGLRPWWSVMEFIAGLAVFAVAMRWDLSDPTRASQRSDVAFWLHLLAAPLLVQPIFALIGGLGGAAGLLESLIVILVYAVMGILALAIDRRALLVSALAFLLSAISGVFEALGAVSPNVALSALIIGSVLLLLSAFWSRSRALVLGRLPTVWRDRLPGPRLPAPDTG